MPAAASAEAAAAAEEAEAAAEAAAAAAEAAAQATMASQALLAAVQSQGASTPTKPRQRKEPRTTEKHSVGSAFSAEVVREKDAHPGEHNSDAAIAHDATRSAFPAEMVREKDSHPGEEQSVTATAKEKGGTATRAYAPRGTRGTYQGKRPPKNPEKLEKFMKAKAIYEAEMAELRKSQGPKHRRQTPNQEKYRAWLRTFAPNPSAESLPARSLFIEAAAEWQKMKAKQVEEKYEL